MCNSNIFRDRDRFIFNYTFFLECNYTLKLKTSNGSLENVEKITVNMHILNLFVFIPKVMCKIEQQKKIQSAKFLEKLFLRKYFVYFFLEKTSL